MNYQHNRLFDAAPLGAPGPLPPEFVGLAEPELADLSWVGAPLASVYAGTGYIKVETPADLDALRAAKRAAIMAQRDARMRAGFSFAGAMFDYDDASQRRITGAAALAGFALTMGGKEPGDLRWHGGSSDFVWIAQDNTLIPMDAVTCFGFGQAAAAWEQAHVFAARSLKDQVDAAADASAIAAIDIANGWPA